MFHTRLIEAVQGWDPLVQKLAMALVVLVGGYVLMRLAVALITEAVKRNPKVDRTLAHFVKAVLKTGGWLVLGVVVLGVLGVNVAALMGGLAVGGFIVGFALKDTLGNLAAGAMLLFYRPFDIGDTVSIASSEGEVVSLGMSLTVLRAADGRLISIPNGTILDDAIVNHTRAPTRRADVKVGIGYKDDIDAAVRSILKALADDPRVLRDPEAGVRITSLGESSVDLQVRPWVKTEDYWQAQADFHAVVKRAVEAAGCSIPFPQRDLHVFEAKL